MEFIIGRPYCLFFVVLSVFFLEYVDFLIYFHIDGFFPMEKVLVIQSIDRWFQSSVVKIGMPFVLF